MSFKNSHRIHLLKQVIAKNEVSTFAPNDLRKIDQSIRQICLYHGSAQQSLSQDITSIRRQLMANDLSSASQYLHDFNLALDKIGRLAESSFIKQAFEVKEQSWFPCNDKQSLNQLFSMAESSHNIIKGLLEELELARSHHNPEDYHFYLSRLASVCNKFNQAYESVMDV
jgi:hypothetical protein